jgi:hypothetical protein
LYYLSIHKEQHHQHARDPGRRPPPDQAMMMLLLFALLSGKDQIRVKPHNPRIPPKKRLNLGLLFCLLSFVTKKSLTAFGARSDSHPQTVGELRL